MDQTLKHDEEGELQGNIRTCETGPSSERENEAGSDEVELEFILLCTKTWNLAFI